MIFVPYGFNVAVEIKRENGSAKVIIHAPMYKNKIWTMAHSYKSDEFTDWEIVRDRDFVRVMINYFGA